MKAFLLFPCLLVSAITFSQQFGTILVSDYDDPAASVEGVSVYFGKELLGTTNHVGSFHFPKKVKGKITLSHPGYVSRELTVKSRENQIIDTNIMLDQQHYDAMKRTSMQLIYRKCEGEEINPVSLGSSTSAISLQSFNDYVSRMMSYPKRARDAGISGTVQLRFHIDETGKANCVEILKGASFDLDKEAFRILSSMPRWTPAKRNGIAVEAVYDVEIAFVLK